MLVLVAVVQNRLAGHTLLSPGDGGHFPHSPGGPVPDVPSLHTFAVSLARGGALHLSGSVGVDGPEVLVLLHPPTEGVSHVIVVILLSLALHEQAGALDELVHGHAGDTGHTGHTGEELHRQQISLLWSLVRAWQEDFSCVSRTGHVCLHRSPDWYWQSAQVLSATRPRPPVSTLTI